MAQIQTAENDSGSLYSTQALATPSRTQDTNKVASFRTRGHGNYEEFKAQIGLLNYYKKIRINCKPQHSSHQRSTEV